MTLFKEVAEIRLLGRQTEPRLLKKNKIIIHTMVGTLLGTDSMFKAGGFDGTESHFGTSAAGRAFQWQDTDFQADANLEANDDAISIENEDWGINGWKGVGPVPPFTVPQMNKIIRICVEVCVEHDIPPRELQDSEDASKGIGWHRQGIDPFRKHGEHWSTSTGKVCPGDARIKQVKEIIIPRVRVQVNDILNPKAPTPLITKALQQNQEYRDALRAIRNKDPKVQELEEACRRRALADFRRLKRVEVK